MLKAVVVGEEGAAAGRSWKSPASWGDRGAVGVQVPLPGLGILVTGGCFPRYFPWDFLHLSLCAFKTLAFEESPGIAQACISVTAS